LKRADPRKPLVVLPWDFALMFARPLEAFRGRSGGR